VLIGFFANPAFFEAESILYKGFMEGIFYGGGGTLLFEQVLANVVSMIYSFAVTFGIMIALKKTIGVRVDDEHESTGLDLALHGETAYHGGGLN
jgi:Amt family ammonium transporter